MRLAMLSDVHCNLPALEATPPGESRASAKLLLDPQQLDVLGDALRPRRRAALDLRDPGADNEISDCRVFRLAAPVAHHRAPAVLLRRLDDVERL